MHYCCAAPAHNKQEAEKTGMPSVEIEAWDGVPYLTVVAVASGENVTDVLRPPGVLEGAGLRGGLRFDDESTAQFQALESWIAETISSHHYVEIQPVIWLFQILHRICYAGDFGLSN